MKWIVRGHGSEPFGETFGAGYVIECVRGGGGSGAILLYRSPGRWPQCSGFTLSRSGVKEARKPAFIEVHPLRSPSFVGTVTTSDRHPDRLED